MKAAKFCKDQGNDHLLGRVKTCGFFMYFHGTTKLKDIKECMIHDLSYTSFTMRLKETVTGKAPYLRKPQIKLRKIPVNHMILLHGLSGMLIFNKIQNSWFNKVFLFKIWSLRPFRIACYFILKKISYHRVNCSTVIISFLATTDVLISVFCILIWQTARDFCIIVKNR